MRNRLATLDRERSGIGDRLTSLEEQAREAAKPPPPVTARVTMTSPTAEKIALFRNLFRGREEMFPRRWENASSGKAGYSPACRNEWVRGICGKPQVKCGECPNQAFVPFGEDVLRSHLTGRAPGGSADFTAGVYPMLSDETCWFLAADFDKKSWMQDIAAFRDTAQAKGVPVAIERSRSGNGAHAWIFFSEPVGAGDARRLGARQLLMHPGPVNRGIELSGEVIDSPQSLITNQVAAGVVVRMAVLYEVLAGAPPETDQPHSQSPALEPQTA